MHAPQRIVNHQVEYECRIRLIPFALLAASTLNEVVHHHECVLASTVGGRAARRIYEQYTLAGDLDSAEEVPILTILGRYPKLI